MSKLIVLDCDGVLLDYNLNYGLVYEKFMSQGPKVKNLNSFHAHNCYDLDWTPEQAAKAFNDYGWDNMPALTGALEAVKTLKSLGYKIVVLTSIPLEAKDKRHQNLLNLGFPIDDTIACLHVPGVNTKKKHLEILQPDYFVDDLKSNFHQIFGKTQCILIEGEFHDSPNNEFLEVLPSHQVYKSLKNFVDANLDKL